MTNDPADRLDILSAADEFRFAMNFYASASDATERTREELRAAEREQQSALERLQKAERELRRVASLGAETAHA